MRAGTQRPRGEIRQTNERSTGRLPLALGGTVNGTPSPLDHENRTMRTKPPRLVLAAVATFMAAVAAAGLNGCTYLETQLQRAAPPDTRITLGWQDRVQLTSSEIASYTCERRYMLVCDRAGSITYSCTCALR